MKKWVWVLALACLVSGVFAQTTQADRAKKADEILMKMRQLDLLNQLLPVLMTKDQIKRILPQVEKARQTVRDAEKLEFDYLKKLEPKVDSALKDAFEKGKVPVVEMLKESYATLGMMSLRRQAIAEENTDLVLGVVEQTFNEGQIKAARNALTPNAIDPRLNPKEMDDKAKLRFWVKTILLDPLAYELLIKLGK